MSDDISIPRSVAGPGAGSVRSSFTHSYRARRTGMDASTRRLFMAASALGLVLLAGMGVWTFGGHRAAGVPVIEADTRPLRVKPENPGGMTVVGVNEQVMSSHGDGTDVGDLAPEAERPDPQALRAQRQVASAPPAAPMPMPATQVVAPHADGAAVTPAVLRPTSPAPGPAPAAGTAMVQVAAMESEAGAMTEWQRLTRKAPELLGDRKPSVVQAEKDGKIFWRLRTGGFADTAAAAEFCRKVRAKGLGCSIAS